MLMLSGASPSKLKNRAEQQLWCDAYVATLKGLLAAHDGQITGKPGLTQLCEEGAWNAVDALRRALNGERPQRAALPPPRRP